MLQTNIAEIICTANGSILIIFYSPAQCWQFRIISHTGGIFGSQQIYYSSVAALTAGRKWLHDED
jgi:hypothetical protein